MAQSTSNDISRRSFFGRMVLGGLGALAGAKLFDSPAAEAAKPAARPDTTLSTNSFSTSLAQHRSAIDQVFPRFSEKPEVQRRLCRVLAGLDVIKQGDVGEEVSYVQSRLAERGFYKGKIDGIAGPAFERACLKFSTQLQGIHNGRPHIGSVALGHLLDMPKDKNAVTPAHVLGPYLGMDKQITTVGNNKLHVVYFQRLLNAVQPGVVRTEDDGIMGRDSWRALRTLCDTAVTPELKKFAPDIDVLNGARVGEKVLTALFKEVLARAPEAYK